MVITTAAALEFMTLLMKGAIMAAEDMPEEKRKEFWVKHFERQAKWEARIDKFLEDVHAALPGHDAPAT
jgi:hypothetical protein